MDRRPRLSVKNPKTAFAIVKKAGHSEEHSDEESLLSFMRFFASLRMTRVSPTISNLYILMKNLTFYITTYII